MIIMGENTMLLNWMAVGRLAFAAGFLLSALFLGGCIVTEREKRGVSTIPFNSPDPQGRNFEGEF